MIRIDLPKEPYWLDLPGFDVRLQVRPLTTALVAAARAKAQRLVAELPEHVDAVLSAGGAVAGLPGDADGRAGMAHEAFLVALAQSAVIAWEGVFGAGGEPAPVRDDGVAQLIGIYPIGDTFLAAYAAPRTLLDAEKNVSRPAPNGTGAAGLDTAGAAASPDAPAPAAAGAATDTAAPTSSTSP